MNPDGGWLYERGEGRHKHRWPRDHAGFISSGSVMVGKCASSITNQCATRLLRTGVVYNAPGTTEPEHIYAVYQGVIYEASPTRPGISFHGYPWSAGQGRPSLPRRILRQLRASAEDEGYLKEFDQWLKQYG